MSQVYDDLLRICFRLQQTKTNPITITTTMCSTIFPTMAKGKWPKLFMHTPLNTTFPLMASSQVPPSICTLLLAMSLLLRGSFTSSILVRDIYPVIILSFPCTQDRALYICSKLRNLEFGTLLHSCMIKAGFESNPFCQGALINLYAECSFLCNANAIFDAAVHLDTFSWTALISGYVRVELPQDALQVFDRIQIVGRSFDQVVFVNILNALVNLGKLDDACKLFRDMHTSNVVA
ncbi:hypothetical protein AHAS_Ahas09G0101300 [Arachis hypogaea]